MGSSLLHLSLEPYAQRYTQFLEEWEREAFSKKFDVTTIRGQSDRIVMDIMSGSVLDSTQRPLWTLSQIAQLLQRPEPDLGKIYCSDFYTPGLDAIPYSGKTFQAYSFCWAQTFDQYDFTQRFIRWMRPWEVMSTEIYRTFFVASPLLADLIKTAIPFVNVEVVGLPFNSAHVLKQWDKSKIPSEHFDCIYTSRWDKEKNPGVFLQLAQKNPDLNFAICTGWPEVRGSDRTAINHLRTLQERGANITVFTGLTKGEYYAILTQCSVQFNSAWQDWVSFTLLEALTFGCKPLYPNFRSFPEALMYAEANLYRPLDVNDASIKLRNLLQSQETFPYKQDILRYHDGTLDRIAECLKV
jgi:hypothetical protein